MKKNELIKLFKQCWDISSDRPDQIDRINSGLSNFDKPTYPDFNTWIKDTTKCLNIEIVDDLDENLDEMSK